jgi:excisionase family DNA binding protein
VANDQDWMLVGAAAREFGVGKVWLGKRVKDGRLPAKRVGRYVLVRRADVEKLVTPDQLLLRRLLIEERARRGGKKRKK